MKDDLKKKLNKRLHPALLPRKKRFLLLVFTGLPAGFVYALISGTGVKLAALFTALAGVVVLGGFALKAASTTPVISGVRSTKNTQFHMNLKQ